MITEHQTIREHTDLAKGHRRLGRHVHHDPRSWDHPAAMASRLVTTHHIRLVDPFDQGEVGSCTGNAADGMVSTAPFARLGNETEALGIYADATHVDRIAGIYPPDDTGSSGLAVAKVLKTRGWIKGYTHSFGIQHTLKAIVRSPGITGISWREGCDSPNADGVVRYEGAVRGGHEIEIVGIDVEKSLVWFCNSWGKGWGLSGLFAMSFSDYAKALADNGDATFPVL